MKFNKRVFLIPIFLLITGFFVTVFLITSVEGQTGARYAPTPTANPYPTPDTPRHGVTISAGLQPYVSQLGQWVYNWSAYNGTYPSDYQLIPMLVWNINLPSAATIQSIDAKTVGYDYWLVFNECENPGQCNRKPDVQAEFYHDDVLPLINANDPSARLIVGGTSAHPCGLEWMTDFVEAYRSSYGEDPPRTGWHFHIYPEVVPVLIGTAVPWQPGDPCPIDDPNNWQWGASDTADIQHYIEEAEAIRYWWSQYGSPDDEIWITETGCLPPSICPNLTVHSDMANYMGAITAYLNDGGRWINRYAWYTTYDATYNSTWLVDGPGSTPNFTAMGNYYKQIQASSHVPGFLYWQFLPFVTKDAVSGGAPLVLPTPAPLSGYPPPSYP